MKGRNEKRKIGGYYVEDIPNYIKRYSSYLLIYPFTYIPESSLKRAVRKLVLNFYNSVPLFIALNKGDIAVQVGTPNVRTMKRFSRYVGSLGKVIIIEADKDNVAKLESAMARLNLRNVEIIPCAAWSEKRELVFYLSDIRNGDHKLPVEGVLVDNDFTNEYSKVKVEADTVDSLLEKVGINFINYISITVNGAELEVLKGMKNLIKSSNHCRIYSKGHSQLNGEPLNQHIKRYLEAFEGYKIVISRGEKSNSGQSNWKRRAGDIFAWKNAK